MANSESSVPLKPGSKSSQILAGARSAFLEFGYEGASVDEIARRAKVSKPTLYAHFPDKRTLFIAFVQRECEEHASSIFEVDLAAPAIEPVLYTVGKRYLREVLSPLGLGIFRIMVSESERFPALGRAFYTAGHDLSIRRLALLLASAVGRGELVIDDVEFASEQFLHLCLCACVNKVRFQVIDQVSEAEVDRVIEAAVRMFLQTYRVVAPRQTAQTSATPCS